MVGSHRRVRDEEDHQVALLDRRVPKQDEKSSKTGHAEKRQYAATTATTASTATTTTPTKTTTTTTKKTTMTTSTTTIAPTPTPTPSTNGQPMRKSPLFFLPLSPSNSTRKEALSSATFWTRRGHRCLPFSPGYLPSLLLRIGPHFSAFYARRFASNFANSRSSAFGLPICKKEPLVRFKPTTSTSVVTRLTIGPPETPDTYKAGVPDTAGINDSAGIHKYMPADIYWHCTWYRH